MDHDAFARDLLIVGLDDGVSFSQAVGLAIRKYAADQPLEVARECALSTIGRLALDGLIRVGTLDQRGGFVDRGGELDALLARVRDGYDGDPRGAWRHVFWFRDTPAGARLIQPLPEGYNPFEEDWRSAGS